MPTPALARTLPLLAAYAVGALAGYGFARLGTPLPWLIGPLVAVAALRLLGVPLAASAGARNAGLIVVGAALGLYFTPAVAQRLFETLPLVLAAAFGTLAVGASLSRLLARTGRVDRATAWFASLPGGAAEMAMLAHAEGGQTAPVAVAQLLRVVGVVLLVPSLFAVSGVRGDIPALAALLPLDPAGLGLLFALAAAAGWLLIRLGLRAGWMLGPLAVSLLLSAGGVTLSGVPAPLSAAAQVTLGAHLGTAFDSGTFRRLRRFLPAAMLHVLLLGLGCGAVGTALAALAGVSLPSVLLGTAPGGVAEMSLTAKTLGLDVAMVVTLHVVRIFLVALLAPPLFRLLHRRAPRPDGGP